MRGETRTEEDFKKNKKAYTRLSDHIGLLPLVIISPADVVLIDGASEERRRFIDGVISQCDKEYLQLLIRYNRVLMQRNSFLRNMRDSRLIQICCLCGMNNLRIAGVLFLNGVGFRGGVGRDVPNVL